MKLTANDLRRLAEGADGTRDKDLYFGVQNDSISRLPVKPPTGTYVTVHTGWNGPGLRGTEKVSVTNCNVPDTADAAFTSQSAFEKFALPYYVRTKSIAELKDMLDKFYEEGVVCVYHEPSSESGAAKKSGLHILKADGSDSLI